VLNESPGSEYENLSKEPKKKPVPEPSAPVFTKKENATLAQRIQILAWHHKNGRNQLKTAQHFSPIYPNLKIKQPLVSAWLKEESKWQEQWEQCGSVESSRAAKRLRQTEFPQIDEMLHLWVEAASAERCGSRMRGKE
jgi:hypothetical protein